VLARYQRLVGAVVTPSSTGWRRSATAVLAGGR